MTRVSTVWTCCIWVGGRGTLKNSIKLDPSSKANVQCGLKHTWKTGKVTEPRYRVVIFFVTKYNWIYYILQYRIISNIKIPIREINTDVPVRTQWRYLTRRWWVRVYTVCVGIPLPYPSITTVVPIHVHMNGWTGFKYLFIRDCKMRRNINKCGNITGVRMSSGDEKVKLAYGGHTCLCIVFWLNIEWLCVCGDVLRLVVWIMILDLL